MPIDTTKLRMELGISAKLSKLLERLLEEKVVPTDLGDAKHPRVDIYRLRRALAPVGVLIQSHRDLGYWLEDEDRGKLAVLAGNTTGVDPDSDDVGPVAPGVDIMEGYEDKDQVDGF